MAIDDATKKKITKNSVPKNIDLTIEFKIVIMITSLISDIIAKFKTFNDSYFLLIKTIKQIVKIDKTIDDIEIIILVATSKETLPKLLPTNK